MAANFAEKGVDVYRRILFLHVRGSLHVGFILIFPMLSLSLMKGVSTKAGLRNEIVTV